MSSMAWGHGDGTGLIVGRGDVMAQLHGARGRAESGLPTFVSLVGEAGYGKTAVLRSFLRSCDHRSEVFLGSAQENAPIPYLAFTELLSRLSISPGSIGPETDSVTDADDTSNSEWQLWRAVSDGVRNRAAGHLLVIGIDDLHWADQASIRLIEHLTTSLADQAVTQPIRLLLVMAGRSTGADARTRSLLTRSGGPEGISLTLAGLDESAIGTLVHRDTGTDLNPTEMRDIHQRTGGNPLLIRLLGPGIVSAATDDPPSGAGAFAMVDEWDRRLGQLSGDSRRLLDAAAIHGQPLEPTVLCDVISVSDLGPLLLEAVTVGLLVEETDGYHFAQPDLSRHLRFALPGGARQRLHARTATALLSRHDSQGGDRSARSAVLAIDHHLRQGGPTVDLPLKIRIACQAGELATAMGAWSRAVDAYSAVLPHIDDLSMEGLNMDDHDQTEVVVRAATALHMDDQPDAAVPLFTKAIEVAGRTGATELWGQTLIQAVRNRLSGSTAGAPWPEVSGLRDFAEREGDPARRSTAWVALADVSFVTQDHTEGLRCCAQARRLAEIAGDNQTLAAAEYAEGLQRLGQLESRGARECFERCGSLAAKSGDEGLTSWWMVRLPISEFLAGDLPAAARHLDLAVDHCRRNERWADRSLAEAFRCAIAALGGHFAEAFARADHALDLHRRTGYPAAAAVVFPQLANLRALGNDLDGVDSVVAAMAAETGRVPGWLGALARIEVGVETSPPSRPNTRAPAHANLNSLLGLAARARLSQPGDHEQIAPVAASLQSAFDRGTVWVPGWTISVPRALATAVFHLGDLDGARQWLHLATDAAGRAAATTESIQIALLSAAIDRAGNDGRAATTSALQALELAEEIEAAGLALAARRALDEHPRTGQTPIGTGVQRTLLFTDIKESTNLNVRVGDDRFVALLDEHNEILRARATEHGGVVFHNTGDGFGLWFSQPIDAVACANEIHRSLRSAANRHPDHYLSVRIGIACGSPTALDGDLFGVDVVRASRLCATAEAETVVVDRRTADSVGPRSGLYLHDLGPVHLKGFPTAEPAFRIQSSR